MRYCLSVGLHNLFFDIAIVDNKHKLIEIYKCEYNRNKDISSNIKDAYQKYFSKYKIESVGVGVSNNIEFKDDIIFKIKAFDLVRYNLKQSLYKLFKVETIVLEETYCASLAVYNSDKRNSLLFLIVDNKISNSIVIDGEIIDLDDDINLRVNKQLNLKCSKDALKTKFIVSYLDDDYVGGHFISNNPVSKSIIKEFAVNLNKYLEKIVKEIKVDKIVFAGYIGEYLDYFKEYMPISKKMTCTSISDRRNKTLIGISHLIFKDNG